MEATNNHELAIAKIVDRISTEDRLSPAVIPELTAALDFMMSRSDSEFLGALYQVANGYHEHLQAACLRLATNGALRDLD